MTSRRSLCFALSLVIWGVPAGAKTVVVLDYNILTYDNPGSAAYNALVRIVQTLNPDVILFEEANNASGRQAFLAAFAARYPHSYLGAPSYENPRNQIISAYPLTMTGQIFAPDPSGGTFERPTVWADVDVVTGAPGAELRVYAAHYKAGSDSRDNTLRLNQATADALHIEALVTTNPKARVYYAGDLNTDPGSSPVVRLTQPQTTLTRLSIYDPNNGNDMTRWESGRTIDHILYSATLAGSVLDPFVFHTETFAPGTVPPPALSSDSHTASDHLALVSRLEIVTLLVDFDSDGDVDDVDLNHLAGCMGGAGQPVPTGCQNADIDFDHDVDQSDYSVLQRCLSGANLPAEPTCSE